MKRIAYLLITLFVITIIFLAGSLFLDNQNGKGALQVTSNTPAQVFLDGKYMGKTPLCLCEAQKFLDTKDYSVKIVPDDKNLQNFEQKISIHKGILTAVERTFNKQAGVSSGSVITFSTIDNKGTQLLIISSPQGSRVVMDNSEVGITPLLLNDVTPSDHEIKILKDGYSEKIIKIKTLPGKKLEASVMLGINIEKNTSASASASTGKIVILDTPTGYLRVRKSNSVGSLQVGTLRPGDKLELLEEKEDWYRIKLSDGKDGWVSATYAIRE